MSFKVEILKVDEEWITKKFGIEEGDIIEVFEENKKAFRVDATSWIPKKNLVVERL